MHERILGGIFMAEYENENQNQPEYIDHPQGEQEWPAAPDGGQSPVSGQAEVPYEQMPGGGAQYPGQGQMPDGGAPYPGQEPYPNQGQNPYQPQWQDPYQNQGQNPYPPQWQNPYQNQGQNPYPPQGQPPYNNGPYYNQYNDPYNTPYGNQPPKRPRNGFATVSLICGIFSILCLCCFAFPLSIIMGVGAILFAVISKKDQPFYGTAVAGIVLGAIAVILGVIEFAYIMYVSSLLKDPENAAIINEFMRQLEQQMQQMQ